MERKQAVGKKNQTGLELLIIDVKTSVDGLNNKISYYYLLIYININLLMLLITDITYKLVSCKIYQASQKTSRVIKTWTFIKRNEEIGK